MCAEPPCLKKNDRCTIIALQRDWMKTYQCWRRRQSGGKLLRFEKIYISNLTSSMTSYGNNSNATTTDWSTSTRYRWSAVFAKEKYRLKVGNTCWSGGKRDLGKWARSGGLGSGRPPRRGKPNRSNSKE